MKAINPFETPVNVYKITRLHIPEDRREDLKTHAVK
jgi:hypothetical protein